MFDDAAETRKQQEFLRQKKAPLEEISDDLTLIEQFNKNYEARKAPGLELK